MQDDCIMHMLRTYATIQQCEGQNQEGEFGVIGFRVNTVGKLGIGESGIQACAYAFNLTAQIFVRTQQKGENKINMFWFALYVILVKSPLIGAIVRTSTNSVACSAKKYDWSISKFLILFYKL